eukprot:2878091-Pleurochrysis_carterae.AAC.1
MLTALLTTPSKSLSNDSQIASHLEPEHAFSAWSQACTRTCQRRRRQQQDARARRPRPQQFVNRRPQRLGQTCYRVMLQHARETLCKHPLEIESRPRTVWWRHFKRSAAGRARGLASSCKTPAATNTTDSTAAAAAAATATVPAGYARPHNVVVMRNRRERQLSRLHVARSCTAARNKRTTAARSVSWQLRAPRYIARSSRPDAVVAACVWRWAHGNVHLTHTC